MCGGSMTEKINAAFILFDLNNSGTMSFDELATLIKTVLGLVKHTLDLQMDKGKDYGDDDLFVKCDFNQISLATAEKAFADLMVPKTKEINYQQFVQWITGENMYDDDELDALQRTQPPSKSKFAAKKFNDANEWCKRFMQEEEFIDVLTKMRAEGCLENVSLVRAKMLFSEFKEDGHIDRKSFMSKMKSLIEAANPNLSDNQRLKMDLMLRKLYGVFDIDKNNILDVNEVAACLVVLCKGSLASKVSFGFQIFSSVDTPEDVKIKYSELRAFLYFIFRLSLETQSETLLDYDLETMAGEVV